MNTLTTIQKEPLDALLNTYRNIFDIDKILARLNTDNLTERERTDLLSLPLAMLNYSKTISDLVKWLIRYHADSDTKFVSDIGLLLAIEDVESLRADLIDHATNCLNICTKEIGGIPGFPVNKNND